MFILGVGAHKAGTTWLWKQLGNAPGRVSLGRKELHYWDNLIRLGSQTLRDEQELQAFMTDDSIKAIASLNHDKYFTPVKRAQRVRWGNRNEQRFTADITPAYAGLPRGVFAYIRRQLQLREVDYRIIYFMRDPVARIVSAFNYLLQTRTLEKFVKSPLRDEGSAEKFIRYATSTHCQLRTRYEITVANLSEVFPSDRLFFGFNESISDSSQIEGLSDFLNLPVALFNPARAVLVGRDAGPYHLPSAEIRDELRLLYRSTYEGIQEKFPEVSRLWSEGGRDTPGNTHGST